MPRLARSRPDSGGSDTSASLKALPPETSLNVGGIAIGGSGGLANAGGEVTTGIVGSSAHWTVSGKVDRAAPTRKSVSLKLGKALGSPSSRNSPAPGPARVSSSPHRQLRASSVEVAWGDHSDAVVEPLRRSSGGEQPSPVLSRSGGSAPSREPLGRSPGGEQPQSAPHRNSGSAPPRQDAQPSAAHSQRPKATSRPPPADGRPLSSNDGKPLAATAPASVSTERGRPPPAPTRKPPSRSKTETYPSRSPDDDAIDDPGRVYAPLNPVPPTPVPRAQAKLRAAAAARGEGLHALLSLGFRSPTSTAIGSRAIQSPNRSVGKVAGSTTTTSSRTAATHADEHDVTPPVPPQLLPRPLSASSYQALLAEADDIGPPTAPRIAWSDGVGVQEDAEEWNEDGGTVTELAAQIRRELLARRVAENWDDGEAEGEAEEIQAVTAADRRLKFDTEEGRQAGEDLERSLKEAKKRASNCHAELDGYLDSLRSRTFLSDPVDAASASGNGEDTAEPLVSLPIDFDDIVDLNTQISSMQRRRPSAKPSVDSNIGAAGKAASASSTAKASGAAKPSDPKRAEAGASVAFKLPSFLEKYFFEEKGVEELPHLALEAGKTAAIKGKEANLSEAEKLTRQIERLDELLVKREAAGSARVQVAKMEVDETRERLRKDTEMSEQEKVVVLKRLKDRGMLKNNVPSCASGRATTSRTTPAHSLSVASSSAPSSARGVAVRKSPNALVVNREPEDSLSPNGRTTVSLMDWSGWTSTDAESSAVDVAPIGPVLVQEQVQRPGTASSDGAAEVDTATFSLTSTTSVIGGRAPQRPMNVSHTLAVVTEDEELRISSPDPSPESAAAATEVTSLTEVDGEECDDLLDDPYAGGEESLNALRRIDEQLQRLVPEREWEAKSIYSLPVLCSADRDEQVAGGGSSAASVSASGLGGKSSKSRGRSIWSRGTGSGDTSVPRDPVLFEQFESRETAASLAAIDGRLVELQQARELKSDLYLENGNRAPAPEEMQKLLMQALQDCAPPDATSKVMALTGGTTLGTALADAASGSGTSAENLSLVPLLSDRPRPGSLPDSGRLQEARRILHRLAIVEHGADGAVALLSDAEDNDGLGAVSGGWEAVMGEAAFSLEQLGQDLISLEKETLATSAPPSRGVEAGREPNGSGASEEPQGSPSELSQFVHRLEELREEAGAVIDREMPIESLRLPPEIDKDEEAIVADEIDTTPLDVLVAEPVYDPGFNAVDGSAGLVVGDGDSGAAGYPPPRRSGDADGPSFELLRALDIQLPSGDGQWDDAELERISRAMDAHYGDEVPENLAATGMTAVR